ncbi:MAG: transcriptional regulator, ArsR family [Candidatus Kentron sp. G]|nr:MAG: transcriptional regulator, ArsR family [Candidatus Kentron sp. G]VFN03478.1 MAG: transcriptional regulator, ArsR family [Candidatus Kentron sp. G]VFN04916.1 MAG: transcriptional regulator, ArsR family [Candidatus Kentron sp. G]
MNISPREPVPNTSPSEDEYSTLTARALKAMAHPLRWRILCTLGSKELSVSEIVERAGTSQSNVSQHLEQLRNKNIVIARKEANRVYYRIRNDQLLMLIGTMREVLCPANLDARQSAKQEQAQQERSQ